MLSFLHGLKEGFFIPAFLFALFLLFFPPYMADTHFYASWVNMASK
jgi:hypothetical protein